MSASQVSTQAAIVGGGPAGVMLGFLLARAGVRVAVIERLPMLRRIPARVIGMGFRPEHVQTPDVASAR